MKKIRISRNEWMSFIMTLIATLFGVLIAIWLTNSGIRSKEKEDTIKLLNTASIILDKTSLYSENLNKTFLDLEKDTIKFTKEKIKENKKKNPIPYPNLLETIISSELLSKNVSEFSYNSIYTNLLNLKKAANYDTVEFYLSNLEQLKLVLELEIKLLKGQINEKELIKTYSIKQREFLKEDTNEDVLKVEIQK